MERENVNKTLSLINDIETVNTEIESILSDIQIPSRTDLLKEIVLDVIEENYYIKEHGLSKDIFCETDADPSKPDSIESILDNLIQNIHKYPSKKVIYLRLFLDRFHDISEQDKNVIIQSVKDENSVVLKEKLLSLVGAFKLEL